MSKVVYMQSISLDGFVEGPNREIDWHRVDEELHAYLNSTFEDVGAFLEGRVTYELMEDYWPAAGNDPSNPPVILDFARIWNDTPKYVYSRTLETAGPNATIVREVEPRHVEELKQQHGNLMVGGADLAAQFIELGLVTELRVYVHPVVIGAGKPLFAPGAQLDLRLLETKQFGNGVVLLHYATDVSSVS